MRTASVLSEAPRAARTLRRDDDVAALVKAAGAGEESCWEALVERLGGTIRAVARAHRLGEADAADVAQVTWLRLLEHVERLHEPGRVGAWLATTARRESLRVLRDSRRRVPLGDDGPELESADTPPGDALMAAERDRALWRGFKRLRSSDQALLRLLMAEPRPAYEEISAALDIPIGSIGPTRARALERLRHELDSEGTLTLESA
jgi:RNA polymerase sigma factor (sigma-70 family)